MLYKLSHQSIDEDDKQDGYCNKHLFNEIIDFWESFDSDTKFIYLVSGGYEQEFDLNGHRSYFMTSDEEFLEMLFDYLTNTLGWTQSEYIDNIYNTNELTDELDDLFYHERLQNLDNSIIVKSDFIKNDAIKFAEYLSSQKEFEDFYTLEDETKEQIYKNFKNEL